MGKAKRLRAKVDAPPDTWIRRTARAAWARREPVMWAAIFALVIAVQWPMLKGYYYRATGAPAPASAITWRADLDGALAEARSANKKGVIVDFYASWCPPCIAMKHEVWPDRTVAEAVNADYVAVQVDADRDQVLSARYRVESLPTVLLLDASGRVIKRNEGFLPQSGILRMLAETGN